ncbi:CaiB/BaiF CoA transferase family protein [Serinicoccus kebangsaanensis]|uniref:CaiB/BaiF CoA transferase family protein n=1 Tax=Serinicoccus kebangsaanensis TaxID=2602069 RepID=UPI00124CEEB9|nr:CoA transferase [Serinicoccus kebangsaanensis]
MSAHLPLAGVTVLDLSHLAAGPWCTMLLADLGAEVIKIERPGAGDMARHAGSVYAEGESAVFLALNRNKRSVVLDLTRPEGQDVFGRLVAGADAVVENLRPGKAAALGVDRASLEHLAPALVYVSISAFGADGPYAGLAGNDPIVQALSGAMSITGEEDGPPARQGVSVPDFAAGMLAAQAVLAGLLGRARHGGGAQVDLNLLDAEIFALGPRAQEYLINGEDQPRLGSGHPQFCPYQAFRCQDGRYLYLSVINDKFWRLLCAALGRSDLLEDVRYASNRDRVARRDELVPTLAAQFAERDADAWLTVLHEAGVPCAPVNTLSSAMTDPQVVHNEIVAEVDHPTVGRLRTLAAPMRFDGARPPVHTAPPRLGADTRSVLQEHGLSVDEVDALLAAGVVAEDGERG